MKHLARKLMHHATRTAHHFKPSTIRDSRQKRNTYQYFTEQNGFVYFGYVDHTDDDHNVIRGLTATSTRKEPTIASALRMDTILHLSNEK